MNNDINEKKYNDYQKKKFLRYIYLVLSIVVVALEILVLFNVINIVWGIIFFIILYILKKILIK